MVNFTILSGGYQSFIASYIFNSDASTLSLLGTYRTGNAPSWLAVNPTNSSVLYATNEGFFGALQSYTVTPGGVVSAAVDTMSSGGADPAHAVPLSTGQVAVMNYSGGNGRVVPMTDALHFATASESAVITFPPPSGGVSHPHMAYEYGSEILVPDLASGADTVWRLVEDGAPGVWKIAGSIAQPAGSGPRHVAVVDGLLYTLHELASTLSVQTIPELGSTNTSTPLDIVSIIPSDPPAGAAYGAAEILIPETNELFPTQYIYVSNRNIGTTDDRGDSIAIFEFKDGSLNLIAQVYTKIDQVRGMQFGGENSQYLVAGGVVGTGGVAIFERTDGGKNLVELARNTQVLTRTSMVWL